MTAAYLDSSCIVAAAFGDAAGTRLVRRLTAFDRLFSSPLLEAEVFSALKREGRAVSGDYTRAVDLVTVDRPLTDEVVRVLAAGYLRGADCWHLATALFLAPDPGALTFLTLDTAQGKVARTLGFPG